ncbi:glycerophosphodiester phosphodiesterase family protein [Oceanobacillus salinisoli]|uniref:glycerophosphodiester phosphodiesterase family protein n=1 Tax=Oceanobacillus salinisoli TaxID=2678611 RepID=UPI0012E19862|nr:glycerophosphodiester phosphodiesterase family protein [Oceanobacillus salinisoli]
MRQHDTFTELYNQLLNKQLQNYPVAHRGIIRLHEPIPENSLAALHHCIRQGVLFMEIDLQKTKDGELVLMHDTTVNRMTNGSGKISDMTLSEIKSLYLYEGSGKNKRTTKEKIPTFEEALDVINGKAIANVDKGWEYREEVFHMLKKKDMFQHVLIKSDKTIKEVQQFLKDTKYDIYYMHKVFNRDVENMEEILHTLCPLALEVSFFKKEDTIVSNSLIQELQQKTNVWLNALDVSSNAGVNDSLSLVDPSKGWGWLMEKSPNLNQTDYSLIFNDFKETNLK